MYRLYKDGKYVGQFQTLGAAMLEAEHLGIESKWKSVSLSSQTWKVEGIKNSKTGSVSGEGLIVYEEEE